MGSESGNRDDERVLILGDLQGEIMVFEPLQIKEMSRDAQGEPQRRIENPKTQIPRSKSQRNFSF